MPNLEYEALVAYLALSVVGLASVAWAFADAVLDYRVAVRECLDKPDDPECVLTRDAALISAWQGAWRLVRFLLYLTLGLAGTAFWHPSVSSARDFRLFAIGVLLLIEATEVVQALGARGLRLRLLRHWRRTQKGGES